MFTATEISQLTNLVNKTEVSDILSEKEQTIPFLNPNLIMDQLFIPKHNNFLKTIRLKKAMDQNFNVSETVESICEIIKGSFEIRLGCSIICQKSEALIYYFSIKNKPINNHMRIMDTIEDRTALVEFFKQKSYDDLLQYAFSQNMRSFESSGFRPRKLVLCTFWGQGLKL